MPGSARRLRKRDASSEAIGPQPLTASPETLVNRHIMSNRCGLGSSLASRSPNLKIMCPSSGRSISPPNRNHQMRWGKQNPFIQIDGAGSVGCGRVRLGFSCWQFVDKRLYFNDIKRCLLSVLRYRIAQSPSCDFWAEGCTEYVHVECRETEQNGASGRW